jgi:hypothetical protein
LAVSLLARVEPEDAIEDDALEVVLEEVVLWGIGSNGYMVWWMGSECRK